MKSTPFPLIFLLLCQVAVPALAEEPTLPVAIPAAGYVMLNQKEFDSAEWYKEDMNTGAKDYRIRMDCGSKALQSILPNSYDPPFDKPGGYLNLCVPTEKMSHTDSNWKYYFSIDPPVYMHPDFNLGLNVIIPNFYGAEAVYRSQFEHWVFEEKIDPVSGERYEEATVYTLNTPKMKWTVILVDGFGRELENHQHDLTAPQWNARASVDFDLPPDVGKLRAIPIDPLNKDGSRYYPYRTPPMVLSAALSSTIHIDNPIQGAGPGWDVDVYPAFGTAILQPTTGIEALPPPEDIGVFNDAGTSQLTAKWLPVEGAVGYLLYSAAGERTLFQPYDSSPLGHRGNEWFPMDVWLEEYVDLLTGDSALCSAASLGYSGTPDPNDKYENYIMIVPVGPKLGPDSPYYRAGRPSKAFGIGGEGTYYLTLDKDGTPRVRGPVVKSYAHDAQTHGIHDVGAGAVRTLPGMGFGAHPGKLSLDGDPFSWGRVVEWSEWQLRLTAGSVPGEGTLQIVDHDGILTKTALATIETKPSLGEPPAAYAVPGQPFLIPWYDKSPELPPAVSVSCDLAQAPGAAQLEVDKTLLNTGTGNLEVYFKVAAGGEPPYYCPCNLWLQVDAADGKAMQWPDWTWAFTYLPIPVKSHVVVRRAPKGSGFLHGVYSAAMGINGSRAGSGVMPWETRGDLDSGPPPHLARYLKGLAWSFGSTSRHPLTPTDMAAVLAVLESGNNVMLVGQFFLRELADGDPGHFGATGLKLEGYRAVQLGKQLDVPVDSPAFDYAPGGVKIQEACWGMIAYLPIPSDECEVVMTTTSVKGDRPAVVVCNDHLLISAVPEECLVGAVDAWVAAMKWN